MRRFLGYSVALLGLSFLLLLFLRLWDIVPIHWDVVMKVFLSVVLLVAAGLLLVATRYLFFTQLPRWRDLTGRRNAADETLY